MLKNRRFLSHFSIHSEELLKNIVVFNKVCKKINKKECEKEVNFVQSNKVYLHRLTI